MFLLQGVLEESIDMVKQVRNFIFLWGNLNISKLVIITFDVALILNIHICGSHGCFSWFDRTRSDCCYCCLCGCQIHSGHSQDSWILGVHLSIWHTLKHNCISQDLSHHYLLGAVAANSSSRLKETSSGFHILEPPRRIQELRQLDWFSW
jgi:hypothetical protein